MEFDTSAAIEIDDLDRAIIHAYWVNPKAGNAAVAREIGVSEATIRRRLRVLLDANVLQFSVVLGSSVTGGYIEFQIGINAPGHMVERVASDVAALPRARYVAILGGGRWDVLVAASMPSVDEFLMFRAAVAAIEGVQRTEALPVAKVLKRTTSDLTPDDILAGRPAHFEPAGTVELWTMLAA